MDRWAEIDRAWSQWDRQQERNAILRAERVTIEACAVPALGCIALMRARRLSARPREIPRGHERLPRMFWRPAL